METWFNFFYCFGLFFSLFKTFLGIPKVKFREEVYYMLCRNKRMPSVELCSGWMELPMEVLELSSPSDQRSLGCWDERTP